MAVVGRPVADREQEVGETPEEGEASEGNVLHNGTHAIETIESLRVQEVKMFHAYKKKVVMMNQIMR